MRFEARKQGDKIVLTNIEDERRKWLFVKIEDNISIGKTSECKTTANGILVLTYMHVASIIFCDKEKFYHDGKLVMFPFVEERSCI